MSSLYVDKRGVEMRLDSDAIAFFDEGGRIGTVPTGPLERIYLRGDVVLSSGLLGQLGKLGIGVIILSGRRAEPTLFLPRSHNDALIRVAQTKLHLDPISKLTLSQWLVRGKIKAQLKQTEDWLSFRISDKSALIQTKDMLTRLLLQIPHKPDCDSLRGLEGAGAAQYFKAYASILPESAGFRGRNRRPPKDPANALLSLSYTLLMAEAGLAAHGHGFDPAIGFMHELDFARPSFACDIAEPLRPIMDRFVWKLLSDQTIRARDFSYEKDGACLLMKAGRERYYAKIEEPLVETRQRLNAMLSALRVMIREAASVETLSDHI
jgi:CRISPR-associated protein Cas1